MPNPKTIKEIDKEIDSIKKSCDKTLCSECSNEIFQLKKQKELILSLLDEVESRLPKEKTTKGNDKIDDLIEKIGFNDCRQEVIKILSDLREK